MTETTNNLVQPAPESGLPTGGKPAPDKPITLAGRATIWGDHRIEFVPKGEGKPIQNVIKKKGESTFYETTGRDKPSYVAHLKVSRDSADPASELQEQLESLTSSLRTREPPKPRVKCLMNEAGVSVWHNRKESKIIVRMEIDMAGAGELSSKLFNLTAEVNKCLAINQKKLTV